MSCFTTDRDITISHGIRCPAANMIHVTTNEKNTDMESAEIFVWTRIRSKIVKKSDIKIGNYADIWDVFKEASTRQAIIFTSHPTTQSIEECIVFSEKVSNQLLHLNKESLTESMRSVLTCQRRIKQWGVDLAGILSINNSLFGFSNKLMLHYFKDYIKRDFEVKLYDFNKTKTK